jgi:hypothetical protein
MPTKRSTFLYHCRGRLEIKRSFNIIRGSDSCDLALLNETAERVPSISSSPHLGKLCKTALITLGRPPAGIILPLFFGGL